MCSQPNPFSVLFVTRAGPEHVPSSISTGKKNMGNGVTTLTSEPHLKSATVEGVRNTQYDRQRRRNDAKPTYGLLEGPELWVGVNLRYPAIAKLFSERPGENLVTVYLYTHMVIRPRAPEPAPLGPSTLEILRPHVGCTACSLVSLHGPV